MDAKTLRASILQMAIEGKLVPQLDEEPAVEQIGDAPEEVPFEIPGKWKWCFIGNCVEQVKAGGDKPDVFSKDKTDSCSIPVIANGEKNLGVVGYTNEGTITRRSLTVSGRGTIGFSAIRTPPFTPIVRLLVVFESPEKYISLEYLQFFLASLNLEGNGSAVKQLTAPMLRQTTIPVPPIAEQRRIVAHLNKLLPLVDKFGKAQEALAVAQKEFPEKLKASLLQEAIQGKLVPQLDEEPAVKQIGEAPEDVPFAIPEKWKWVSLSQLITLISGRDLSSSEILSAETPTPYITGASQIVEGKLVLNRWTNSGCTFSVPNDLLIVCKGSGVGKLAFNTIQKIHIARQLMAIRATPSIDIHYVYFAIQYFSPRIVAQAKGVIPGISRNDLLSLFVPLPPLSEQRRIIARLNELLPLVTQIAATTAK